MEEDIDKIVAGIDLNYDDYIHKDKIRKKIKELITEGNYRTEENPKGRIHFEPEPCDFKIQVLQELLKED